MKLVIRLCTALYALKVLLINVQYRSTAVIFGAIGRYACSKRVLRTLRTSFQISITYYYYAYTARIHFISINQYI